jgi:predicted RNA methylase
MLKASNPQGGETLYDLGSGDGSVVIEAAKLYGLDCIGIEMNPKLVRKSKDSIRENNLNNYIKIKEGNIFDFPLGDADIVTTYLTPYGMRAIENKVLSELRPSARLVSHEYGFSKIKPNETKITWDWADGKYPPMLFPQPVLHWINLYRMDDIKRKKSY